MTNKNIQKTEHGFRVKLTLLSRSAIGPYRATAELPLYRLYRGVTKRSTCKTRRVGFLAMITAHNSAWRTAPTRGLCTATATYTSEVYTFPSWKGCCGRTKTVAHSAATLVDTQKDTHSRNKVQRTT